MLHAKDSTYHAQCSPVHDRGTATILFQSHPLIIIHNMLLVFSLIYTICTYNQIILCGLFVTTE